MWEDLDITTGLMLVLFRKGTTFAKATTWQDEVFPWGSADFKEKVEVVSSFLTIIKKKAIVSVPP